MRVSNLFVVAPLMLVAACTATDRDETITRNRVELTAAPVPPTDSVAGNAPGAIGVDFVARVVGDTEDVWGSLFTLIGGGPYPQPKVVIYNQQAFSACGIRSKEVHPSYCAADGRVYLDRGYLADLAQRTGVGGEFAVAYLIAHEIGHHVQETIDRQRGTDSIAGERARASAPRSRVELELQADCYAGVWAHSAQKRGLLDTGDLEHGVPAALAAGDPLIQDKRDRRYEWFRRGLDGGDPLSCVPGK